MSTVLQKVGKEASRDKWLVFALCAALLVIWMLTRAELIGTLLTASVGGFLGLMKSSQQGE